MELDPIEQRVIVDRPGVGGPAAEGLAVQLSRTGHVLGVYRREGDEVDGVDLDVDITDRVATTGLHLRSAP